MTEREIEIEKDLRTRHSGMMTTAEVMREIGTKKEHIAVELLAGLPAYEIGKRMKYRIADVAKRLAEREV